jgi:hypothetical protein
MKQFDAFFSYNREDQHLVKQIADNLEKVGIKVWFDESLGGGQKWLKAITQNITDSSSTIVFFGPSGIGQYQDMEIETALSLNVEQKISVIPVILPGVIKPKLPLLLKSFNWIDLRHLNLDELIEAITGRKSFVPGSQIGDDFLLKLQRPNKTVRYIKIHTLPNSKPDELLHLTWKTFGIGIENLNNQIMNYGFHIHSDACIGINDAGLVMSTFLNSFVMDREKIGYIRYKGKEEGRIVSDEGSFFPPGLGQAPTIMLVDFEIKSGTNLKIAVDLLRQKYPKARIYFSVFGALTEKDDLKINCVEDLKASDAIKDADIEDIFIACTIHLPGIDPPLRLR